MNKFILCLIFILIVLTSIGSVCASDMNNSGLNTNFSENNISSDGIDNANVNDAKSLYVDANASSEGNGLSDTPYKTLSQALNNSHDGDTIFIAPGTYSGKENTNLSIDKKLNLVQWNSGEDGGAIYIDDENWITFSQCVFANNQCGDEGGAIYLDSSSSHLKLFTNIFCNNKADEGQSVYNCGKFDSINNNWWGNNPSSDNDQLIEWKPWPLPNSHHVDNDPLKLLLKLSADTCEVNSSVWATACFYYNNGKALFGTIPTEYISFMPISNVEFDNRIESSCFARILVSPQKAGQYTITANLFGETVSAVLSVIETSSLKLSQSSAAPDVVLLM